MVDPDFINGGRATPEVLAGLRERLLAERVMQACITAMPELVLILNRQRQIIAVNPTLLASLGLGDAASLVGSRPGEVLHCVHAHDGPDGCGTGRHCEVCGAALALEACQRQRARQVQECLLTVRKDGAQPLELEVVAAPLLLGEDELTLCAMRDISDQKRREALERLFLHDVANTVAVISALSELMRGEGRLSLRQELLDQSVRNLVEEINGQRALHQAEHGELRPEWGPVDPTSLLRALHRQYATLAGKRECSLRLAEGPAPPLRSDEVLLRRVLGNLLKNAIEAVEPGETVTLAVAADGDGVRFAVRNPQVIADDVREQMFQRSFSTKGRGRGLGTYGARLIGEGCLGGRVAVRSEPGFGTEVGLWLPLDPADYGTLGGPAARVSPSRS
jgi:signal transduction histidine kinase